MVAGHINNRLLHNRHPSNASQTKLLLEFNKVTFTMKWDLETVDLSEQIFKCDSCHLLFSKCNISSCSQKPKQWFLNIFLVSALASSWWWWEVICRFLLPRGNPDVINKRTFQDLNSLLRQVDRPQSLFYFAPLEISQAGALFIAVRATWQHHQYNQHKIHQRWWFE